MSAIIEVMQSLALLFCGLAVFVQSIQLRRVSRDVRLFWDMARRVREGGAP